MAKFKITKKDVILIIIFFLIILLVSILGNIIIGKIIYQISILLAVIFILFCIFEVYRRLNSHVKLVHSDLVRKTNNDYHQIESLFSLFFSIKPSMPFPTTRKWAASPDLLKLIIETLYKNKPELVIEASSGISTLIIAYCLKNIGKGKVVSLEHDPQYAKITRENIKLHGLGDFASIIHAPLKRVEINDKTFLWYNLDSFKIEQPIDLLVIDGPPASIQRLARYPALPLLYSDLHENAIIILDDGCRKDEKEIVKLWEEEFNNITHEYIELEKGAFLIHANKKLRS